LGKPVTECQQILDFNAARYDGGGSGANHDFKAVRSPPPYTNTRVFYRPEMPFLSANQQCQSIEGKTKHKQPRENRTHENLKKNKLARVKKNTHTQLQV